MEQVKGERQRRRDPRRGLMPAWSSTLRPHPPRRLVAPAGRFLFLGVWPESGFSLWRRGPFARFLLQAGFHLRTGGPRMFTFSLLRRSRPSGAHAARPRHAPACRPRLEALEDRLVPANLRIVGVDQGPPHVA